MIEYVYFLRLLPQAYSKQTLTVEYQVSTNDQEDTSITPVGDRHQDSVPASPPPSFRSRASSPTTRHLLSSHDPLASEADRTLADAFGDGETSGSDGEDGGDDRQDLIRHIGPQDSIEGGTVQDEIRPTGPQRTATTLPLFPQHATPAPVVTGRAYGSGTPFSTSSSVNDGVFANLNAKPERGEKTEELPPVSE